MKNLKIESALLVQMHIGWYLEVVFLTAVFSISSVTAVPFETTSVF